MSNVCVLYLLLVTIRSSEKERELLSHATPWMRDVTAKLKAGSMLPGQLMTQFRYFCMAILSVLYHKSFASVANFKVCKNPHYIPVHKN